MYFFSIQNIFNSKVGSGLCFVAVAGQASCALPLLALGWFAGFGVAARCSWGLVEMPVPLSVLLKTRKHNGATVHGGDQGQLFRGEDLGPQP